MNKTKENTKTMLYLLSLGIAFIVGTALIGTASAASPIFQETFENLDEWHLVVYDSAGGSYWDPAPLLDTTMGNPAPSLDVNGNSQCGDGAYTKETFNYKKGLVIEFDMYVASGYDWNWGNGGLSDHMPNLDNPRADGAYVDPLRCGTSHIARVSLCDDACYNTCPPSLGFSISAEDGTRDGYRCSDASEYENEWHTYKISIRPDGYVEFYMNGMLIWTSTKKIDKTLGSMPLLFGERDAYGPVRIDNVNVYPVSSLDIDPDILNLKSEGKWITAYIELPEGYDVADIDVSTILLEDTISAEANPTEIGDYDDDGIADLMVKFDRSAVQEILEVGDEVEITVTEELTDGTLFEGSDTIRVIDE